MEQTKYVILTVVAMASGLIGNTIIILVIFINHIFHTTGNEFIINMALADLIVSGVAQPMCLVGMYAIKRKLYSV